VPERGTSLAESSYNIKGNDKVLLEGGSERLTFSVRRERGKAPRKEIQELSPYYLYPI